MPPICPAPLSVLGVPLESLTDKQKQALNQMRENFAGCDYPEKKDLPNTCFAVQDYLLLKYLLATKFDTVLATKLLQKQLEWRKAVKPEEIEWGPGMHREITFMGRSRAGHPILFSKMGTYKPAEYTEESYMKSRVYEMEEARRILAREGWKVDRIIVINDMRGYNILDHANTHSYRLATVLMHLFTSAYMDQTEVIYLLNAPLIFQGFWQIMRRVTGSDMLQRIRFVNDPTAIQELIDRDNIYDGEYGGTKPYDFLDRDERT